MSKVEIYYFSGTGNRDPRRKRIRKTNSRSKSHTIASLLNKDVIETNGESGRVCVPYLSQGNSCACKKIH